MPDPSRDSSSPDPSTSGPELSEAQWAEIQNALFESRKIQAIKLYRTATGAGLKEAKDAMDAYDVKLRAQSPASFSAAPRTGCFGVIVLFLGMCAAGWLVHRAIG